ncbi:N-acetylmuramoyl-L-alanine amidase [Modestobacter sp. L9-4]|nr:N-acetylmuramoyl-L-alanine amidase [Modestobacter sp. L9-4]
MVRRCLVGSLAATAVTGTFLVPSASAAPLPAPGPVATSSEVVALGSVVTPAPDAAVRSGTTDPVAGVAAGTPTLTVTRTDVDPFSLVGVTWALDPAVTDTVVSVRVQDDGGAWGSWTEVTAETADQQAGARPGAVLRGGTSPLWTGPSTGVDVELVTRSGARPTDVRLDLVDPGSSPADDAPAAPAIGASAQAAVPMPPVYSRAQWGADESIRTWGPQYATTLKAATLHHTADSNDYTADQVPAIMRSIYRYHTVSLGWGDIGYNVIVDKFGRSWEGRYGGLSTTVMGAHAGGFNTATFGVSMLGNYDTAPVPQATVDAVAAVIAWKFSLFGVDPRGTTQLTSSGGGTSRYASGVRVTLPTVFGHRDVGDTVCPGRYGYARLAEIRTQVSSRMASPVRARYDADAALRARLGAPTGGEQTSGGVTWQVYANGRLYWSATTGAHAVWGDVLSRYLALGGPGVLGAPVTDHTDTPRGDGAYAHFQNGSVYWSPATGSRWVRGMVMDRWSVLGREQGVLGFPTSEEAPAADGGSFQTFQGGMVFWSPATGAHEVHGWVLDRWSALGRERGWLGYPVTDEVRTADGAHSSFVNGDVYSTAETGPVTIRGAISAQWRALGAGSSALGRPLTDEQPAGDGVGAFSSFAGGVLYWSPVTGAHAVTGVLAQQWQARGGVGSRLGYPTAEVRALAGGGEQAAFQGGQLFRAPGAVTAAEVRGAIGASWAAQGGPASLLGWPVTDEQPSPDGAGVSQTYERGVGYWSPATGVTQVLGAIEDHWTALGGLAGPGAPIGGEEALPDGVGRRSVFTSGTAVYWSPASGAWSVRGAVRAAWDAQGGERGLLGYPTSDETPLPSGRGVRSTFQRGDVYWSAATGAREVHGVIRSRYLEAGGPSSSLGLPVSDEQQVPGGARSDFEGGSITFTTGTGVTTLTVR